MKTKRCDSFKTWIHPPLKMWFTPPEILKYSMQFVLLSSGTNLDRGWHKHMCREMWAFFLVVTLALSANASGNDSHAPAVETPVIARGKLLVGTGGAHWIVSPLTQAAHWINEIPNPPDVWRLCSRCMSTTLRLMPNLSVLIVFQDTGPISGATWLAFYSVLVHLVWIGKWFISADCQLSSALRLQAWSGEASRRCRNSTISWWSAGHCSILLLWPLSPYLDGECVPSSLHLISHSYNSDGDCVPSFINVISSSSYSNSLYNRYVQHHAHI